MRPPGSVGPGSFCEAASSYLASLKLTLLSGACTEPGLGLCVITLAELFFGPLIVPSLQLALCTIRLAG